MAGERSPQMLMRKGVAGAGFEIGFQREGLFFRGHGDHRDQVPGSVSRRLWHATRVVSSQSFIDWERGKADVRFHRVRDATHQVNVIHGCTALVLLIRGWLRRP